MSIAALANALGRSLRQVVANAAADARRWPDRESGRSLRTTACTHPGMGRHSTISIESPGKIVKCGWPSNSLEAASSDSARTTV